MENYTHFAIYKPTGKIVNGWNYNGYEPAELKQFKKDYFIDDLVDMGMNPQEITILTKRGCASKGINPMDNSSWQNYPFNENKSYRITETQLRKMINESLTRILFENVNGCKLCAMLNELGVRYKYSPMHSFDEMKPSFYVEKLNELNIQPISHIELEGGGFFIELTNGMYATGSNFMITDGFNAILNTLGYEGEAYDMLPNTVKYFEGREDDCLIIFKINDFQMFMRNLK